MSSTNEQNNCMTTSSQNIQVAVRCRPLNEREKKQNSALVLECNEKRREITVFDRNALVSNTKTFTFDRVFGWSSKQADVYNQVVRPVVMEVIEGYNCTIFAYGQTGTGKTFTMEGERSTNINEETAWEDDPMVGIIPRSVAHLFSALNSIANCEYSVKVSYIELYNEELSDLLSDGSVTDGNEKLRIFDDPARKGSVIIPNLEEALVRSKSEVYKLLLKGADRRQKAATLMNSQSSRSHTIFTMTLFIKEKSIEGEETIKVGKLNLVDLAGSENIERSGATGRRAAEAGKINKSLTTLGRVITALVEHRDHIPYRESNLTRLLQDSLGGKTKTTIIATISPALCNLEETLSTLDYAHKAKSIRNKPEINQKLVKKALIKEYTEEIDRLKRELTSAREKNGIFLPPEIHDSMVSTLSTQKEEIRELLNKIGQLEEEMEKVNNLFNDTKLSLEQKCDQLNTTEITLCTTRRCLEATQAECEQTKYLLGERVNNEGKLYSQATNLVQTNYESQNDCKALHEKIERMSTVSSKNRSTLDEFNSEMTGSLETITKQENELIDTNKQRLNHMGTCLNELDMHLEENRSELRRGLLTYDEKQHIWASNQQNLLEKELQQPVEKFAKQMKHTLETQTNKLCDNHESCAKFLNEHREMFERVASQINQSIESAEKNVLNFQATLAKTNDQFLLSNAHDSTETARVNMNKLDEFNKWIEHSEEEVKFVKEVQTKMDASISEMDEWFDSSINSLVAGMNSFKRKMKESSELVNSRCRRIEELNRFYSNDVAIFKQNVLELNQNSIKKMNSEFEQCVIEPVKNLIEFNLNSINEMNILTKSMNERNEEANTHYLTSINTIKMTESENNTHLSNSISTISAKLDATFKKFHSNMDNFKSESSAFLNEFISQSVHEEIDKAQILVQQSNSNTLEVKKSLEKLNEMNKEFYANTIRLVNQLCEKDYVQLTSTGKTPTKKTYLGQIELVKTKPHEQLLEEYQKIQKSKSSDDIFKMPNNVLSMLNDCTESVSMKVEVAPQPQPQPLKSLQIPQPQQKRPSDKENTDVHEKASKIHRSVSSTTVRAKNYTLNDRN